MIYIRKGPHVGHKRQRCKRIPTLILMVSILIITILLAFKLMKINPEINLQKLTVRNREISSDKSFHGWTGSTNVALSSRSRPGKCELKEPCPQNHIAFKLSSGAASVIGAKICADGEMLIDGLKKNGGHGINIAVIDGQAGKLIRRGAFNMWSGKVEPFIEFLKSVEDGSIVLIATADDASSKLNDEARKLVSNFGSSYISALGFRDTWVFVGGKGIPNLKPSEKHIKNDAESDKYGGWPEIVEIEGCIPLKRN